MPRKQCQECKETKNMSELSSKLRLCQSCRTCEDCQEIVNKNKVYYAKVTPYNDVLYQVESRRLQNELRNLK